MKYFNLLVLLSFFIIGCGEATPEEIEQNALHESLYAIHDEVMPKMSQINRVSRSLKEYKEENKLDSLQRTQIEAALTKLEQADEGMMDWMHNYKKPSKWRGEKSHEEIMTYLKAEKDKIVEVKNMMESSISEGESLLKSMQ
jgi:succinate dehydrogenase flavin-adding protein (antitoxin of CptAB toxin-antitoxin module)